MQFLGEFGIDWKLLLAQMINFGILLLILTKFLYKPIIKQIEENEIALKKGKTKEKKMDKEKRSFSKQKKSETQAAKKRSEEIIKEAEQIAKQIRETAQKEASAEKKAVIKQIRKQLANVKQANK